MLGTRILDSFRTAFSRGLFKVLAVVLKDMPRPRAHVSDLFQALAVFFAGHATASFPCFLSHLSGCRHRRTVDIAACRGYIWRFCGVFLRVPGIKIVSLPPPVFCIFWEMVFESCFSCAAYLPLATVRRDIGVDYRLAKIQSQLLFRIVFLLLTEPTWAGGLDWTEGVAVRASAIHCASPRHPTSTGGDGTRGGRPPFSILHSRTDHRQGQQLRAEGNITNNETICLYQWLLPPSTLNLFLPCQM